MANRLLHHNLLGWENKIISIIAVVVLALFSCGHDRRDLPVAQAGDDVLTLEQFRAMLPEGFDGQVNDGAVQLVDGWTDDVLLSQAALDLALDKRSDVSQSLDEAKRMILASAFEREFILPRVNVDSIEVRAYYNDHIDEFVRERDEVRCKHILITDSLTAQTVADLLDSVEFSELTERYAQFQTQGPDVIDYYAKDEMHPKLAELAFSLPEGEVGGPIKTEFGYHFIKLLDFAPKGSIREFASVKPRIRDKLTEAKFRRIYEQTLDSLRAVKGVSIDTAAIIRVVEGS